MGAYSLHMTEDDGEIDEDFPALDNKVTMSQLAITAYRIGINLKKLGLYKKNCLLLEVWNQRGDNC